MNTVLTYLVITMGTHYGIAYQGYGGVSVTEVKDMVACQRLKTIVTRQIQRTTDLNFDGNEIIIECEQINVP